VRVLSARCGINQISTGATRKVGPVHSPTSYASARPLVTVAHPRRVNEKDARARRATSAFHHSRYSRRSAAS